MVIRNHLQSMHSYPPSYAVSDAGGAETQLVLRKQRRAGKTVVQASAQSQAGEIESRPRPELRVTEKQARGRGER